MFIGAIITYKNHISDKCLIKTGTKQPRIFCLSRVVELHKFYVCNMSRKMTIYARKQGGRDGKDRNFWLSLEPNFIVYFITLALYFSVTNAVLKQENYCCFSD
jgi:hypothetical protein